MNPTPNTSHKSPFDVSRVFTIAVLVFIFLIPISQYWSIRLLGFIGVSSLFMGSPRERFSRFFVNAWDIVLYLLVLLIGIIYTEDVTIGWKLLETSLGLLLLPVVLSAIFPFTQEIMHKAFMSFICGLLITCTICLVHAVWGFGQTGFSGFFFDNLTQVIQYQPTYLAYYLCFAMTVGLYFLYYQSSPIPTYLLVLILVFLFVFLMLTGGRTAYISMLFVFSFFILKFLFEGARQGPKKLTLQFSILFLVSMLLMNHYTMNTLTQTVTRQGDYWERLILWESSLKANPDFIFGVGTGDYRETLNHFYLSHGLNQFADDSFNTHNQFLHTLLSNGILGLLSVILLIARPLYLSVQHQNILGVLVFFSFIIYGMTEVFLGRYQGIIFFAFLHQTFISFYKKKELSFS